MILSTLRTLWPPVIPDINTGYKTFRTEYNGETIVKSLEDLHQYAWWTGLKIAASGDEQREFLVTLVDSEGVLCTLRVQTGEVQPFQWALPAHVAAGRRVELHIAPILPDPIQYVNIISYFHEMPEVNPEVPIHFICDDYSVAFSHPGSALLSPIIIPSMHRLYQQDSV